MSSNADLNQDTSEEERTCKICEKWYGGEDDGYGTCGIKNMRGDVRFVTFGSHACDELDHFR